MPPRREAPSRSSAGRGIVDRMLARQAERLPERCRTMPLEPIARFPGHKHRLGWQNGLLREHGGSAIMPLLFFFWDCGLGDPVP